jgi:hypothetical protein
MDVFRKLRRRASILLALLRDRFASGDDDFLAGAVVNRSEMSAKEIPQTKTIYDFLKETYTDIAETDPEAALKMIRQELETAPPKEVFNALIAVERHIRQTYCNQYFRGVRVQTAPQI